MHLRQGFNIEMEVLSDESLHANAAVSDDMNTCQFQQA